MTFDEKKKLYALLSAPFPEEAIERTIGKQTGRGYDTTGIKYQYIANRLNEVLGVGGFRTHRTLSVREITTQTGRKMYEAICDLTLELGEFVDGTFVPFAEALADGGHVAVSEADARKGSYTNAFKKAAAFLGVGKQAYEGTIDDDNAFEERGEPAHTTQVVHTNQTPVASSHPTHATQPTQVPRASSTSTRNRLTSKQLGAIFAAARKLGFEQGSLRAQVKMLYGAMPEFLTGQQASDLITSLNNGALTPNGHDRSAGQAS